MMMGDPAFQLFGVACDSGLRLKTPLLKIVDQHRRTASSTKGEAERLLGTLAPVSNRTCPIGNRTYVAIRSTA
ncbi:MAG: hypothetical protein WC340_10860 [Kiritimatiellia bacterium]